MAENKLSFAEGASINRTRMFSGVNYQFIKSIDRRIWNAIENGLFVPMIVVSGVTVENSFDEVTDIEKRKVQYD